MKLTILPTGMALLFLVAAAVAGQDVKIEQAWARESPPLVTTGAAYLNIVNTSEKADRVLTVTGDVAKIIEIHTHLMEDGMTKMRPVDSLEVVASETTKLEPGGLHVMLIGLHNPLKKGEVFPLTFEFENSGEITVDVTVKGIAEE